ncbi:hypothetical protein EDD15DRAFT_2152778, partial [Pisolithus albus]
VQYRPYLTRLFSIALDVYLQMHLVVNDLVLKVLCRDAPDWRLQNSCPACTYTLKDEPDLKFKLLFAMDGNDSLKRISRAAIGASQKIRAKYPLAVVSKLLDMFGDNLAGGYDIGCKFGATLNRSVVGPRAQALNYTSLVPAFHGYAHRRLCQLRFLARYVTP